MSASVVSVVGAGLAGCEAALKLATSGIKVRLYEMKPAKMSPAHSSAQLCELVCSNSLKADRQDSASGLLKAEMRALGSAIMAAADKTRVPAGGALAVDREAFSNAVTDMVKCHPCIELVTETIAEIPCPPCIVATGPLTDGALFKSISDFAGGSLHFFDAAAPIVTRESIDMSHAYFKSRYDKGDGDDYINCPLTKDEYDAFVSELISAETAPVNGFEESMVFEGCMPVETMAKRGPMTLAFGPLKPKGLNDPSTGKMPWAVAQLRQDDFAGGAYGLVGFQTRLKFPEQRRVFGMIPALKNAEYVRYGVMHRNTYLRSPGLLDSNYQAKSAPGLYFAGQITGVEGYLESAGSGLVAAMSLSAQLSGKAAPDFTCRTMLGALGRYVSSPNADFQPMNANFAIIEPLSGRFKGKRERHEAIARRSLGIIKGLAGC